MGNATTALRDRVDDGRELVVRGQTREAIRLLEAVLSEADRVGDHYAAAMALDWLYWLALVELDGARKRACAKRMLELTVPDTSLEAFRLYVRHAVAVLQLGDARQALAIIEKAEQVSRGADIDSFTMYLTCKADVLAAFGRDEPALEYARLSAGICAKRSDRYALWMHTFVLGYALGGAGQFEASRDTYLEATRVGRDAQLTWEPAFTTARAAWVSFLLGDVDRARALLNEARAAPGSQPILRVACAWISLRMGLALGDAGLIANGADRAQLERALASGDAYVIGPTVAAFHDYYRFVGDDAEADRLLRVAVDGLRSPDTGWALFVPIARFGDDAMIAKANALLERFPATHRVSRAYRTMFAAIRALRAGDTAAGERLAGEAQLAFEDMACRYEAARCLELSGRIVEAQRRYGVLRYEGDLERLRRADAHARRGRPRRGYESSQQRREIKFMLAQGATIKGIADRLGVSDRTVKARVAEIYDDEGVSCRAELLARLRPSG